MHDVIVSPTVLGKLSDLVSYLKDDIKLSEEAAQAYRSRFVQFEDYLLHIFLSHQPTK